MSMFRAGVLSLISAQFGILGCACSAIGALLFLDALITDPSLSSLAGAGLPYALLALGTLFLILSVLAFIANILADQTSPES